jgi:hypothetical protein
MFTFTRRQCRFTAFALLLLFAGALGLAGACAVWCGPLHHEAVAVANVAEAAAPVAHSCCAKAGKAGVAKPKKDSGKAECCAHEKAAKWASVPDALFGKLVKQGLGELVVPPVGLDWLPARYHGTWAVWQPVQLVPPQHLPPKIPDIRVFLHSLTV